MQRPADLKDTESISVCSFAGTAMFDTGISFFKGGQMWSESEGLTKTQINSHPEENCLMPEGF